MRRQIVIGNWKMNGDSQINRELLQALLREWQGEHRVEVAVCPSFTYLENAAKHLKGSTIGLGAQDVSQNANGAYTGDISAKMLLDVGCQYVLVGHSERREYHAESDQLVASKFKNACDHNIVPVLCVGETLAQRESGETAKVVEKQLRAVLDLCGSDAMAAGLVAYEPVWAIGTGKSATPEMAQEVHAHIRQVLGAQGEEIRILYGGSVKPDTAKALFTQNDIDGALVGGASLIAQDFADICRAAEKI